MNDLDLDGVDLRAALHRDADLVGEPSPDLLDQLVRRRQHQRRQRVGLIAVAAAVAVIGAGIPVGASFLTRSHAAPATQTVPPTPSVTTGAAPTTSEVTPPATAYATSATSAGVTATTCLDAATARSLLVASTGDDRFALDAQSGPYCAGSWALVVFTHSDESGVVRTHANWLFHAVDGRWQLRPRTQLADDCTSGRVPAAIYHLTCETD